MDSNSKSISTILKRIIFQGLEKVDIKNAEERNRVYLAATNSLKKQLQVNATFSQGQKNNHLASLEKLIVEIESQLLPLTQKQNMDMLEPSIDKSYHEAGAQFDEVSSIDTLDLYEAKKSQRFAVSRKTLILIFSGFVAICLAAFFYNNAPPKNTAEKLELPYTILAD